MTIGQNNKKDAMFTDKFIFRQHNTDVLTKEFRNRYLVE